MEVLAIVFLFLNILKSLYGLEEDSRGYVVFCPCMGRFGNQVDQYLGALGFVKALDRTLILPPWVEYSFARPGSDQVPFDTYFKVESINKYVRAITMEEFMEKLAPTVWPPEERISFCFSTRHGSTEKDCNAKDGNPFGPFWNKFNIDFVKSEFYGPLGFNYMNQFEMNRWKERYPPSKFKVIAFTGAPGSFPIAQYAVQNHQYLQWNNNILNKARQFIEENMPDGHYIGIHLRLGSDFERSCSHIDTGNLFASAQCLGYRNEYGKMTMEMCHPSIDTIVKHLKKAVKKLNINNIFVATDTPNVIKKLEEKMKKVKFVMQKSASPHIDLAILGQSDLYICGCASTFGAFVTRERDAAGKPTEFWAFERKTNHEEL